LADETTRARSAGGGARGLLAWVVILGLLGLVVWLVSERNARTWYLVPDEGRLLVMRGMKLPVGRQPFRTDDPVLAQVYEPIVVPPGVPAPSEQAFDERCQSWLHFSDRLRRERAGDQAAHARVQRWIVEHQACSVMLIERRVTKFWQELLLLVRAEQLRIAVHKADIAVTRQKVAAVRHKLDRLILAQRRVKRKWVHVKLRRQLSQVKRCSDCAGSLIGIHGKSQVQAIG